MNLATIMREHSAVGIVGNRGTAKTSLAMTLLNDLRKKYPDLPIFVFGVNPELEPILKKKNIGILRSTMDILDLQIRDAIIFIDEMALFFDPKSQSKQTAKLMRFFDRIEHQNCRLLVATAREGYWNKFMCSRITAFLVKEVEYDALVNGSWLKERVKAIASISDYRLQATEDEYYVVTAGFMPTVHATFEYDPVWDTKAEHPDLFPEEEK